MKEESKLKSVWSGITKEKISPILLIFLVINTAVLLIANIIAAKTFPVFTINDLTIVLPCAVILYPFVYIISDILSEVYGYNWSRRSSWLTFGMNLFMVIFFQIAINMPGETDLSVLGSTGFLLVASLLSFMMGDLMNDLVFRKLKVRDGEKKLWLRCILSSVAGQFTDSLIYIPLGMNIFPTLVLGFPFMTWTQVAICIILQPTVKILYEIIISPITVALTKTLKEVEHKAGNKYNI